MVVRDGSKDVDVDTQLMVVEESGEGWACGLEVATMTEVENIGEVEQGRRDGFDRCWS